jgi:tetratricopeptide (TPR) repeat protein
MKIPTHAFAVFLAIGLAGCGPKHHITKGDQHLEGNRPDAATQEYQRALDKDPSAVGALRGMAATYVKRDQPIRAIIPAQRAARTGDIPAHRILARALLTTGRPSDALKTIRTARKKAPRNHNFQRLLVEALIADGQLDAAADTADELLIDIASPRARSLHAWALSRAGRIDDAVAIATDAVAIASDDGRIQAECASIFWKAKRQAPFNRANKMARALLPASPRADMQRANWYAEQGHTERAIRKLEGLRGAYTTSAKVAATLGLLYAKQGAWNNAIRHLGASLSLKPYSNESAVSGVSRMKAGDSLKEGQRVTEIIEVATRLGEAYHETGQHAHAAKAWQIGVDHSQNPTGADHLRIANAWHLAGNNDQMGQSAQTATNLEPGNPEGHLLLARAYDAANNVEWAIRHAQKSWEIDPDQANIVIFLGELYENRGERRVARELYRDALRRHPSDAHIYAAFERVGGTRRR